RLPGVAHGRRHHLLDQHRRAHEDREHVVRVHLRQIADPEDEGGALELGRVLDRQVWRVEDRDLHPHPPPPPPSLHPLPQRHPPMLFTLSLRNSSTCSRWKRCGSALYFARKAFSWGRSACICFMELMLFCVSG